MPGSEFGPFEVADWAVNLPPESATMRAVNPVAQFNTPEVALLREMEFWHRYALWVNATPQSRSANPPERLRFNGEPVDTDTDSPDSMSWNELAEWLGDDRLSAIPEGGEQ